MALKNRLLLAILILHLLFDVLDAQKAGAGAGGGKKSDAKAPGGKKTTAKPTTPAPDEEEDDPAAPLPAVGGSKKSRSAEGGGGSKFKAKPLASPHARPPNDDFDEDLTPDPDPFFENKKWSTFVHRIDAIFAKLKAATAPLATLLSGGAALDSFSAEFAQHFAPLKKFFDPLHEELLDNAAHTQVNPAVGLTDLKKLNEWAMSPPEKFLDQARFKWVEVNAMAITAHWAFDRLLPELEKWGMIEDARDWTETGYPTYLEGVSGHEDREKPSYELRNVEELTAAIDKAIDEHGEPKHMMRSLERILRKHLGTWDPESDYNIYCYGNNEFGIIHDEFDLLTDAAMFLSMADMKHAVLNATYHVLTEFEAATGMNADGTVDTSKTRPPEDLSPKFEEIFTEAKTRIDKKIRIAAIGMPEDILPGPQTFKCDKPPLTPENYEPTPNQPEGHTFPEDYKPPRQRPNQPPPTYPASQWGKPPPEPLSPVIDEKDPEPRLDPQSGPEHPLPSGYVDKRPPTVEYASFSGAYQGYLEAETVLNPDGSCKSTCPDFKRPTPTCANKSIDCPAYRREYCDPGKDCLEKSTCDIQARRCMRLAQQISYCPSSKTYRLYDWVEVNGTLIGRETDDPEKTCDNEILNVHERWEMDFGVILNAPQYCEVCLCICDQPMNDNGIHYFDIQPIIVADGHVITAVRFTQTDNVIRLNVEQGLVKEDGKIDLSTLVFIEPPDSDKNDPTKTPRLAADDGFRSLALDIVYVLKEEYITGVKFEVIDDTLHLRVMGAPIDPETGALKGGEGQWREGTWPPPDPLRRRVPMDDKVNSLRQLGPSQPFNVPENKLVIQFEASSLIHDAGQAVVPFFDVQPTRNHISRRPLTAIGFLYKTKKGYGGFVAPSIVPYRKSYMA